ALADPGVVGERLLQVGHLQIGVQARGDRVEEPVPVVGRQPGRRIAHDHVTDGGEGQLGGRVGGCRRGAGGCGYRWLCGTHGGGRRGRRRVLAAAGGEPRQPGEEWGGGGGQAAAGYGRGSQ